MSCRFTTRRAFTSRRGSTGFWARKPNATYIPFVSSPSTALAGAQDKLNPSDEVETPIDVHGRGASRLRSMRTEYRRQRHPPRVHVNVSQNTDTPPFIVSLSPFTRNIHI